MSVSAKARCDDDLSLPQCMGQPHALMFDRRTPPATIAPWKRREGVIGGASPRDGGRISVGTVFACAEERQESSRVCEAIPSESLNESGPFGGSQEQGWEKK